VSVSERKPVIEPDPARLAKIYRLWDELADMDAAHIDEGRNRLLQGLCELAGAHNASWVGAGHFRTNRLADLVPPEWFQGDYYKTYYLAHNHHDAIWAGVPINADTEIYFGIYRHTPEQGFSTLDRDIVAYALRGLRWFFRQQMLSHGLLLTTSPLTRTEHAVLQGLLQGLPEKQIAANVGQSPNTTHEYVTRIFRKYAVRNRSALMALWLGQGPAQAVPAPGKPLAPSGASPVDPGKTAGL